MTATFNPTIAEFTEADLPVNKTSQAYRLRKNASYTEKLNATKRFVTLDAIPRSNAGRPSVYRELVAEAAPVLSRDKSVAWSVGPFTLDEAKSITQGLRAAIKRGRHGNLRIVQRTELDTAMVFIVSKDAKF